jgi:hypothetical protein
MRECDKFIKKFYFYIFLFFLGSLIIFSIKPDSIFSLILVIVYFFILRGKMAPYFNCLIKYSKRFGFNKDMIC